MRARIGWILGGLGLGAYLARRLRAEAEPAVEAPAPPVPDPRAEELRQRLEESRALVDEREDFESGETSVDAADPEERRRSVHERGRSAADEMRRRGS